MTDSTNPNDQIRGEILQCLYAVHSKSRSPKSAAVKILKFNKIMKSTFGYKQTQVSGNLDYLVQEKFVIEQHTSRSYRSPAGAEYSSEEITYKISSTGINRLEKASLYKAPSFGGSVNIGNIHGVLIMGDGNVVNSTYTEAASAVKELRAHVSQDTQSSNSEKVSALSDLDSMLMQMQKPTPDVGILQKLWASVKTLATVNGAATLVQHLDHIFRGIG
jgi:hypothetical protein